MTNAPKYQLSAGDKLGGFKIVRPLGQGGMGEVYEAFDSNLDRPVALKVLKTESTSDNEASLRFTREGQILARLNHPNVLTVYAAGTENQHDYMAMELVRGTSLSAYLSRDQFSLPESLMIFRQMVRGVWAIHQVGIVHRDLKPGNMMLDENLHLKIIDFGIAKNFFDSKDNQTKTNVVLGTINYMAPEVVIGHTPGMQSDIYALGLIFYEMISGQVPFAGENTLRTLEKIKSEPLTFPESVTSLIPTDILKIISKMTAKRPQDRFDSLKQVLDDLDRISPQSFPPELNVEAVAPERVINIKDIRERLEAQGFLSREINVIVNLAFQLERREQQLASASNADETVITEEQTLPTRISASNLDSAVQKIRSLHFQTGNFDNQPQKASWKPHLGKWKNQIFLTNLWSAIIGASLVIGVGFFVKMYKGAHGQVTKSVQVQNQNTANRMPANFLKPNKMVRRRRYVNCQGEIKMCFDYCSNSFESEVNANTCGSTYDANHRCFKSFGYCSNRSQSSK